MSKSMPKGHKIFRVGGAVRDRLLGLSVSEVDWVVVGATAADLLAQGYKQVGRDFPVFLHPHSGEEYALARTERKTGRGHVAFDIHADADVTIEQDLQRRDLTINAIAESEDGQLVDPYGGQADIEAKILRHVSPAFSEDPLRVLRVARFAARFADLNFTVAGETIELIKVMVASGELDSLTPERVWKETELALATDQPTVYFEVLKAVGALVILFPEIDALFGVPQPKQHHPEIDTGIHTMMVLSQAAKLSTDPRTRFAALVHDVGKATTPKDQWPKHIDHESRGVEIIKAMAERLRIPNDYRHLAELASRFHLHAHRALELRPQTIVKLFEQTRAFQKPERFEQLLLVCEADARGRTGYSDKPYPQADYLRRALMTAAAIRADSSRSEALSGEAIGEYLRQQRIAAIAELSAKT